MLREKILKKLKPYARRLLALGLDPRVLLSYRFYFKYRSDKKKWRARGGSITSNYMILNDFSDTAGITKGHYFHQDLLIANYIFQNNPRRHIDVGSRIDGFVAHVASFRVVEVMDIRPLPQSEHKHIKFVQADLMENIDVGLADSVSCLHAIEHFGLGRYEDTIDVEGHVKGINSLINLIEPGGQLYISFPIGLNDEVHFNAHRVFHPRTILSIPSVANNLELKQFDYVDDDGKLHNKIDLETFVAADLFGCGIYTFRKL